MHRFEIGPKSRTGHVDIDGQLRTLFDLANEVLFGPLQEQNPPEFRHSVTFLFSYLEYHLASEELAMLEHGYPSRRFHAAFHDHIRREARGISVSLARKFSLEEARSAIFFLLEDWAVYHVDQADRQLADYLQEQAPAGVAPQLPGIHPLNSSGTVTDEPGKRALAGAPNRH